MTSYRNFLLLAMAFLSRADAEAERVIESAKAPELTTLVWVLAAVSTLVSILAFIFVIVYRGNKIVTVGQPFFLCLICFGAFLISFSLYFDTGVIEEIHEISWKTLDRLCILQMWCLYCGILIVLVALICKLWRAERACQFRKGQRILIKHVIWPLGAILSIEVILLFVATFVCPPRWDEVLVDPFGALRGSNVTSLIRLDLSEYESSEKLPQCSGQPTGASIALRASSHALILTCQIIVIWMSYRTRNIPEEIVDTKRVYYLMICQFLLYVPFLMLEYGVIPSGRFYSFIRVTFPFLFSITSVGFLVFPKVYYVFYFQRHGKLPDSVRSTLLAPSKVQISGLGPTDFKGASAIDSVRTVSAVTASARGKRSSGDTRGTVPISQTSHTTDVEGSTSSRKSVPTSNASSIREEGYGDET